MFVTYTGRDKNETIKPNDTLSAPNANRNAETLNKITTVSEPIVQIRVSDGQMTNDPIYLMIPTYHTIADLAEISKYSCLPFFLLFSPM